MRRKGLPCAGCRGHRLHVTRRATDPQTGALRRAWVCAACDTPTFIPIPQQLGITCPKCGDCRLQTVRTEHPRPGVEVRRRRCQNDRCRHVIRVKEQLDSVAA